MHMEEKIRQHYVSRLYLDSWALDGVDGESYIWVYNKQANKTYKTANLSNVAQKK